MIFRIHIFSLFRSWILLAFLASPINSHGQSFLDKLDLTDLSLSDCNLLDSILIIDNSIEDWKRIEYYEAMEETYEYHGNYLMAIYCTDSLISLLDNADRTQDLADAYRLKSMLHDHLGQYPEALEMSQEGLKIFKEIGDIIGEANSYNDIGVLHYYAENYTKSMDYLDKSFVLFKELKDTAGIAMYYNNMANNYFDMLELQTSLSLYKKALEFDIILEDEEGQCITMSNIGENYADLGEFYKAEKILLEALVIAERLEDPWSITNPLRGLGYLYQKTSEFHKAVRVLEKNVRICAKIDALPEQSQNYELLYTLYKSKGDYERALGYYEEFKDLTDSLFSMEKERIMGEMEVKYQLEDKANEISQIKQEDQIKDLEHRREIESEQGKQFLLIFGLIGIAVVLFFALRGMNAKKRANILLQDQNTIIQTKNNEIESAYHQIEEKNIEILDSIRYAKRIQSAILPPRSRIQALIPDSFIIYQPKDVVAGDFYWLEQKNDEILIAAADCTGHGVPGAMVSVVCNNGLNRSVREHNLTDPGKILDKTREIIMQEFEKSDEKVNDGMDLALVSLKSTDESDKKILSYAGAHNPLWIIRKGETEIEEIKPNKQPIGSYPDPQPFTTHHLELKKGDTFYLFTDGFADQFGGDKGKKMKTINFKKLLLSLSKRTLHEQKSRLESAFDEWKGPIEQLDDVCIVGVRVR
jgi:serine phosphatase RsbU (regulator of sigma subunit)